MIALMGTGAIDIGNFEQSVAVGDFSVGKGSMAAVVDIVIDAQGKPVQCVKVQVVGNDGLAKETCPLLMRKHYTPAHRANGEAAWFVAREMEYAFEPGTPEGDRVMRSRPAPQLDLQVNRLPEGKASMSGSLLLDIDETGKARDCAVRSAQAGFPTSLCNRLDLLAQPVQLDRAGQPVAYITKLRVRLTAGPTAGSTPAN
ncbi:MAG: hypothetical protein KGJ57_01350 [Sphingomonadales bacterium]|nr:hypothetical protein [Sphingomonadales bacterium]MDE2168054.1 hypothetical protein [Sphingomonadales bacterium]